MLTTCDPAPVPQPAAHAPPTYGGGNVLFGDTSSDTITTNGDMYVQGNLHVTGKILTGGAK